MFYNRPYSYQQPGKLQGSVLQWILVVNLGVFILQTVFNHWFSSPVIEGVFALSSENIRHGFLWTLVTYAVLHAGLGHFLVNSLLIYLFGRSIQSLLGERNFLWLYGVSVLGGGLAYLLFHLSGPGSVIGASAGLAGLITVFCLFNYNQTITFYVYFILPISLKGKFILWGFIGIDLFGLLFSELSSSGVTSGVAHSSHPRRGLSWLVVFQLWFEHCQRHQQLASKAFDPMAEKKETAENSRNL